MAYGIIHLDLTSPAMPLLALAEVTRDACGEIVSWSASGIRPWDDKPEGLLSAVYGLTATFDHGILSESAPIEQGARMARAR
jgi:hypothetical protein